MGGTLRAIQARGKDLLDGGVTPGIGTPSKMPISLRFPPSWGANPEHPL